MAVTLCSLNFFFKLFLNWSAPTSTYSFYKKECIDVVFCLKQKITISHLIFSILKFQEQGVNVTSAESWNFSKDKCAYCYDCETL